ncbi:MFS transporter [Nocardiopsis sp. RV163]|uniref:MFS transporter n=1 Tax=Nocardiopsis sp. RV163 TaxID=1661388 RepID=UPI00064C0BC9|nr:MFS transporter [Nocardiopsis sp. RV163]
MAANDSRKAGGREWVGLAVLALPTMLLSLDVSVLFLALPHLSADLGATSSQQLWISDIYGFMIAGFLVTMGNLGDRIGRRRLLLIGAALFGAASILAALSTTAEMLIVSRALLGIAGSTILPSTLALISNAFHDPAQRARAMAVWGTSFMAGTALGPVVGGVLLDAFWWGAVFLMGVPVMLLLLIGAPFLLDEHRAEESGPLDLPSVLLSLAAILPFIYGLKEFATSGWALTAAAAIVLGLLMGAGFVWRQKRLTHPLFDIGLFGNRTFSTAVATGMFNATLQSGIGLFAALYLQMALGLSPLFASLWLVPPAVLLIISINTTPVLAGRFRPAYVLAGGLVLSSLGYLLMTGVGVDSGEFFFVACLGVVYVGVGPVAALINHLVLGAAPEDRAGSASALSSTSSELGVSMGIAVMGSIGAAIYKDAVTVPEGVPQDAARAAGESMAGAQSVAPDLAPGVGEALLEQARDAFLSGLHVVAAVSVVMTLGLALLIVLGLRHVDAIGRGEAEGAEADTATST